MASEPLLPRLQRWLDPKNFVKIHQYLKNLSENVVAILNKLGESSDSVDISQPVQISGFNELVPKLDNSTQSWQTIDYGHHEIHSGSTFRVQANNASTASLIIAFKVGDQAKLPHMVWEVSHESSGYVQLLEAPTWTTSTGTDRAPKNSRRDSTNTSILEGDATGTFVADYVTIDPTGLAGGTVISDKRWYGDREAAQTSRRQEVVLKSNTQYAFEWTSTDGTKGVQIRLEWYEHEDAN